MAAGDVHDLMGFDAVTIGEEAITLTTTGGTVTETTTGARTGACLRVNRTSAAIVTARRETNTTPPYNGGTAKTPGTILLYLKFDTLPSAKIDVLTLSVFSGNDLRVNVSNTGALTALYVGGTESGTIATLSTGTWYRVEIRWDHTTTTHTANVSVDGGTEATITRAGTAGVGVNGWRIGTNTATAATYDLKADDLLVADGNARLNVSAKVLALAPDSDVDSVWTITGGDATRWQAVDERPNVNTTYVNSSTSGQAQRLGFASYTLSGTEAIKAVAFAGNAGSNGTSGTRTLTTVLQNSGGTDHATTAVWSASINGVRVNSTLAHYILAPGSAAWSQAELDGMRLKVTKSATADLVRLHNVWAYVAITGDAAVSETPLTGGALGSGVAPSAVLIGGQVAGGALGAGTAPVTRAAVAQGGAVAGGNAPSPGTFAVVPGGALGSGTAPAARAGVSAGGALGGGVAPTESMSMSETPLVGGGVGGGTAPGSRVGAPAGGGSGGGQGGGALAGVTPGGALGGGVQPVGGARGAATPAGALGGGVAPAVRAAVASGGALGSGAAPGTRAAVAQGGVVAGGTNPTGGARDTATPGGATGGGTNPTGGGRESATPGGALGAGVAPTSRIGAPAGGGSGGGQGGGVVAGVALAGVVAGGIAPTGGGRESATPGGAVGSGRTPTGVVSSAPAGGAVAAGNGPAARVDATTGGAIADGNVVTEAGEDVADRGGALAAGRDLAGARIAVEAGAGLAGGFPPEPRESDTPLVGGAVGGGTPPSGSATLDPAGAVGSGRAPAVTAPAPIGGALGQGASAIEVPVTNGSLDSWSAGAPVGWSLSLGSASIAEETSDVHAGSAARITYTSGSTQMFQNVTAGPGALRFAVWHKESATGRTLALSPLVVGGPSNGLRLQPDGSWSSAFSLRSLPNSLAWTQHGIDFVLPAGATGVRLTMWAQGGAATFLVDDVTLDALPRAVTSLAPGGAVAGGIAPSDGFTSGDTADVGGAVAGGFGPAARVAVAAGGALGGGNSPDVGGTSETPDRGGAVGVGRAPAPRVTATITGALGAGRSSSPRVAVGTAGASAGGTSPGEGESQVAGRGGATGAGVAPSAWASTPAGGAAAGGRAPTARFGAVSLGGALGGGSVDSGALVPVDVGGGVAGGRPITEPDGGLHVAGGGVPRMGLGTLEVV